MKRTSRRLAVGLAAVAVAVGLAACSGGSGSTKVASGGSVSGPHGTKEQGGTATLAWGGAVAPNFIFPYAPATNTNGYNLNLTQYLWPPLVASGDGSQSTPNPAENLYSGLSYSNDDKTITITLKPWKWSDGAPITSRDFTFTYNLISANKSNWNDYIPGAFPDGIKSIQTPGAHTVVLNLTQAYNPSFFVDDVLASVQLIPQHAWDKTSVNGKVGNYDETTAGAKQVYAFLQKEGGDVSTFTTNPLWKVVDGAWTLSGFTTTGDYTYVPNKNYSGPDKPTLAKFANESFTTSTALVNALRSGTSITTASLPLDDVGQIPQLKAEGYSVAQVPLPGVSGIYPNFYNAQFGPVLKQLYIRQAMEDLIDRPQMVSKIYHGYADPANGPIPVQGFGSLVSPLEKSGGPYPYSPSKALSLLKSHGWKVTPNGVTTCASPGTGASDCGAGIKAGQQLSLQLAYSSGTDTTDQMMAAIQSSEEQAGIKLTLKSEPFDTLVSTVGVCTASSHPADTCGWQLVFFGYSPYDLYPASDGIFDTGGNSNQGGYSDPKEDQLIKETEFGNDPQAFDQYEDYTAQQLPQLWVPLRNSIHVFRSNLGGYTPLNPFNAGEDAQDWYYVKS
ncbi:MAG TPA: peptide ABC transporter substrate-binding protein [Trebonia sp.]|jgi:peptide/nickel transport system substrate-binding protein